jgi:hypothetical protein
MPVSFAQDNQKMGNPLVEKSRTTRRIEGTARIASGLFVCMCLSLPSQSSSGSSSHQPAFVQGFPGKDAAFLARAKRGDVACCFETSKLPRSISGTGAFSMCGNSNTPRVMGSRRLARWIDGLGADGKRVLMSRRLALALHKAASPRTKAARELSSADSDTLPLADDKGTETKLSTPVLVDVAMPDRKGEGKREHAAEIVMELLEVPAGPLEAAGQDAEDSKKVTTCLSEAAVVGSTEEQEWGEILHLSASPSRPSCLTLTP